MTGRLLLCVRTPASTVLEAPVDALRAEDRSGWFGVRPGHTELVAILPVGILVYRDAAGEGFVAVGGGFLHVLRDECRVMVRDAVASRDLDTLGEELDHYVQSRQRRIERESGIIDELAREALRRMVQELR